MSTRATECGYCGTDHGSGEPCPALDGPARPRRATTRRCGDRQPVDLCEPRGASYRCTLPVGHTGEHVMTTHPMHPAWTAATGESKDE